MNRRSGIKSLALMALAALMSIVAVGRAEAQGPGSIAGTVWAGGRDDAQPVDGATVKLFRDGVEVAQATTGAEGRFGFRNLRPGRYSVFAAKDGVGAGRARAAVVPDATTRVRIHLAPPPPAPGSLGGLVFNADGPVGQAIVLIKSPRGDIVHRTQTNDDGVFRIERLRPGRYVVVAEKRGVGRGESPVEIVSGQASRVRIELRMPPPPAGSIAGGVFSAAGPTDGATVNLIRDGQVVATATTNAEGRFGFRTVRPGRYVIEAAKRGVGRGRAEVEVVSGQTTNTRIELRM